MPVHIWVETLGGSVKKSQGTVNPFVDHRRQNRHCNIGGKCSCHLLHLGPLFSQPIWPTDLPVDCLRTPTPCHTLLEYQKKMTALKDIVVCLSKSLERRNENSRKPLNGSGTGYRERFFLTLKS